MFILHKYNIYIFLYVYRYPSLYTYSLRSQQRFSPILLINKYQESQNSMAAFPENSSMYSNLKPGCTNFVFPGSYVQHGCFPVSLQILDIDRYPNLKTDKNIGTGTEMYNVDIHLATGDEHNEHRKIIRIRGGNNGLLFYSAILNFSDKKFELLYGSPIYDVTLPPKDILDGIVFDCVFFGVQKDGMSDIYFFRRNIAVASISVRGAEVQSFTDAKEMNTGLLQVLDTYGTKTLFTSLEDFY